jgi:UDP-perosamine 4-acetyltransferase
MSLTSLWALVQRGITDIAGGYLNLAFPLVGLGSQLFPGSIVNTGASLGANVIVNSGAIVEHDCIVGNHVHIATGARLASTIEIGDGAHVGVGATVRQLISIGEGAVVGAGAVVIEDVPGWTIVVGVPAKPLQRVESSIP